MAFDATEAEWQTNRPSGWTMNPNDLLLFAQAVEHGGFVPARSGSPGRPVMYARPPIICTTSSSAVRWS